MTAPEEQVASQEPDPYPYMTDRVIPDVPGMFGGAPPTGHNLGWFKQYTPEQRYVAYVGTYIAYADAALEGATDDWADFGRVIIGLATVDEEAALAGTAMVIAMTIDR